ncbi:MAG: hypothetical protein AABO57_26445 [Acidobacteriota bacterium]
MDTHLSTKEIRDYLRRRLTRDDFDRVGEHVHSCASCYQDFLAELQKRFPIEIDLDELAGLKGWHLEGEELAAYVEGRMDELNFECASLHLEECGSCMETASAAFEYRLENPRVRMGARRKEPSTWSRYLPSVQSISSPRLQLAAAAVLLLGLALIIWAVLQPRSEKPQLAGVPPPETRSTDPSPHPTPMPIQPGPGVGSDIDHKIDEAAPWQTAANSHEHGGGRQEDEIERALLAKNLTMPPAIEMLDRTPAIAIRGNRASIQSFTIARPFTTLINNDRPTFSWTTLNGATSYKVSVYDADLHLVETSEPLEETQWSMPDLLEAGIVYTWTVTALKDGQEIIAPASPARAEFKILGKPELRKLNRMVSRTTSHAARGVLYAEAGLLDEAEKEFQAYLVAHPHDDRVKNLLQTVRSWRGIQP